MKAPSFDAPTSEWLVYADQLQQSGNPLGELITLNHAVETGKQKPEVRDAWVREKSQILGDAGKFASSLKLGWKLGWIETAELTAKTNPEVNALALLLETGLLANVRSLTLAGDPEGETRIDFVLALAELVKKAPKSLVELELVDKRAERSGALISRDYDIPDGLVAFEELGGLWPAMPQLRKLRVCVASLQQVDFGTLDLPELRELRAECLAWGGYGNLQEHARQMSEAKWPKLETFELRIPETWTHSTPDVPDGYFRPYADRDDEEYGDDDGYHEPSNMTAEIGPIVTSLKRTNLKRLAITSFDSGDALLQALQEAGLPPTLEELDLSHSNIGEAQARWMVENPAIFAKLKRLVLKSTPLEDASSLAKLGPTIDHSHGGGASHRYLVGME